MNLVPVGAERPLRIADATVALDGVGEVALAATAATDIVVGFRPEALVVGDGPLRARIRTVEDLGSEVFVHLALDHRGANLPLVSKMPAPFHRHAGEDVGLQLVGAVHLFDATGPRIVSATATLPR